MSLRFGRESSLWARTKCSKPYPFHPQAFEANGATAILYRMVFHEDLMVTMNNLSGANLDTLVGAKLAYIMHALASSH